MKERIRQVMEFAKMSQQDFANKLGISPASLSSIYTGRTNPTNNHVQAVHRAFPAVNINWLLFGEGEMFSGMEAGAAPEDGLELVMGDVPSEAGGDASGAMGMLFGGAGTAAGPVAEPAVRAGEPNLFSAAGYGAVQPEGRPAQKPSVARREAAYQRRAEAAANVYAKETERPARKVKEIRVFFDDGTYESFVPSGK